MNKGLIASDSLPQRKEPTPVNSRLAITCYCGITRLLPDGLEDEQIFELPPCGKCGMPFRGRFMGEGVLEVGRG